MVEPIVLTHEDKELLRRIDLAIKDTPGSIEDDDPFLAMLATAAPQPDVAFERRLEERLVKLLESRLETQEETPVRPFAGAIRRWFSLPSHRGLAVAALVLVLVSVALALIGPRRVWADIQRWMGYVPGIGFVDLEETRVLTAPVAVNREGVTLRVEQVVAGPNATEIFVVTQGLPSRDEVRPPGGEDFEPLLRLPDGRTLATTSFNLRWSAGTLTFPPLPDGVYDVTLELPRLPLVPAGAAPEAWSVPLDLRPATGKRVSELFPQPYAPPGAGDTHQGITLRVVEVAHSPEETALRLRLQWRNPAWETHFIRGEEGPTLQDDLGHVYWETPAPSVALAKPEKAPVLTPPPTPTTPYIERMETFVPLSAAAQVITYTIAGLHFDVPAQGNFTMNLGDDPEVGDVWPLDLDLEVAGFQVHLERARLIEERLGRSEEATVRRVLQFDYAPVPEQDGQALRGIRLDGESTGFRAGGTSGYNYGEDRIRSGLVVSDGENVPTGEIQVQIIGAEICLCETWTLSWHVPGRAGEEMAHRQPVVLRLQGVMQTRRGLTLRLVEAVDRSLRKTKEFLCWFPHQRL